MYDNRNGFHYVTVGDMITVYKWAEAQDDCALIYLSDNDEIKAREFIRAVNAHTEQITNGISWREPIRSDYIYIPGY